MAGLRQLNSPACGAASRPKTVHTRIAYLAADMRRAHMQAWKHSFAALVHPPTLRGTEGGSGHDPERLFL
jgi:hypothetical protein